MSIQVLESVLDCVGGEVPAVKSAVTIDARIQALMPGKEHLSSRCILSEAKPNK